jgi:dienelactone hydrolase
VDLSTQTIVSWEGVMRHWMVWTAFALGILSAGTARAQIPSRLEMLALKSQTLSGPEFLQGRPSGKEVMLAGELRLPPRAAPKVPAVILVHGSGGIGGSTDVWARELNAIGVAAFILDTFSGRGIVSTVADQEQLNSLAMMVDAYRALDLLAAHPRIRADRIGIMGFSKGAVASVYSASERFRAAHGGKETRFAAHIGFYTPCNVTFEGDAKVGPAPIRMFHGISDDYVAIQPCRDYAARLKAAGADVVLTEYPDSQHAFDNPTSPPLFHIANAQSTRKCRLKEGPDGTVLNAETGTPFILKTDSCLAIGAHIGHNAEATALARIAVREFLQRTLLQ